MNRSPSFTLIELMAASTVLSLVLLLMVGMQDQMRRAWSEANRRTDTTREASAACRMMAEDLASMVFRPKTFDNQRSPAGILSDQYIPFLFSSNGQGPIQISNAQPGSAYLFAVTSRKAPRNTYETAQSTLALVGYYIGSWSYTNVNGFALTNYNLYRYYVGSALNSNAVRLSNWIVSTKLPSQTRLLFNPTTNDEIIARNACNLRITAFNRVDGNTKGTPNKVSNGLNFQFVSGSTATYYSGSKLQVEMSVYPEEWAQKIPLGKWNDSNNLQKYARSFEFRLDVCRD